MHNARSLYVSGVIPKDIKEIHTEKVEELSEEQLPELKSLIGESDKKIIAYNLKAYKYTEIILEDGTKEKVKTEVPLNCDMDIYRRAPKSAGGSSDGESNDSDADEEEIKYDNLKVFRLSNDGFTEEVISGDIDLEEFIIYAQSLGTFYIYKSPDKYNMTYLLDDDTVYSAPSRAIGYDSTIGYTMPSPPAKYDMFLTDGIQRRTGRASKPMSTLNISI